MSSLQAKPNYPRSAEIRRLLRAAQSSGLAMGSIEIDPNGSIRILSATNSTKPAESQFDQLEAAGLL